MPKYNKLVRDNVPAITEENGERPLVTTLSDDDYANELKKKLLEEANEYLADDKSLEELADIMEVVHALAKSLGHTVEELEAVRKSKVDARGAFDKRIFLRGVEEAAS